jgi:WS/DGAT/MGAT family acyltransferase
MDATYEPLSKLDEAFLTFETPSTPMHVALTATFERGRLATEEGGVDVERIRAHVASRLHLIPRYRQRLARIPLFSDAVWVDDTDFDLRYHVRHASLPRPGSDEQLRVRCAEILERPLNRAHPLWEIWIIEGLAGGRFALLTKVHHCMVDGVGGVGILAVLLDDAARGEVRAGPRWQPRPTPGGGELLGTEVLRRGRRLLGVGRELRAAVEEPRRSGQVVRSKLSALWSLVASTTQPLAAVPFNGSVGLHRRVAWLSMSLDEMKAIRRSLGGTVNDVVLTTVAGGMRRYLARGPGIPRNAALRIVVPVNVRDRQEEGALGNHVSVMMLALRLDVADVVERFQSVRETTAQQKIGGQKDGGELLAQAAEWTTASVRQLAVRLISSASPYNLIVTNVPGPQMPLYLLGARMREAYPHLPLFENQGLGVAIFSYDGRLYWGLTGDWERMADLDDLAADLFAAFRELADTVGVEEPAPRRPVASAVQGLDGRKVGPRPQSVNAAQRRIAPTRGMAGPASAWH